MGGTRAVDQLVQRPRTGVPRVASLASALSSYKLLGSALSSYKRRTGKYRPLTAAPRVRCGPTR